MNLRLDIGSKGIFGTEQILPSSEQSPTQAGLSWFYHSLWLLIDSLHLVDQA